jgi:hypothetical protein
MEIESQVFPLFASFIRDLGKTYPEIKNCLYRNYEECLVECEGKTLQDAPKLQAFLEIIHTHKSAITKKDPQFFNVENILEDISFSNLWEKNISDKTRETIWKYFQTFGLLSLNLKSSQALQDALSSIQMEEEVHVTDKSVAKQLRQMKALTESVQAPVSTTDGDNAEFDLESMMGGMMDSNIGKIAQEVAGSMDMEAMFGNIDETMNPMELMTQMMNPDKMGKIFQNINSVMETKVASGELSKDDLQKEAQGMYGSMSQNTMFTEMMGQMHPEGSAPQGSASQGSANVSREETRKLLQAKIKDKQSERHKK